MTVTEARPPSSREGTYVGGLDGLRAIAVAAVIVFHFAPSVLPAGFLGVDVFFVVSGFLISRLVVREIAHTGTVGLRTFWARRARRLLPALATVTVVVLVVASIKLTSTEIHDLRAQALGTLFYVANWVLIFGKNNYFTSIGRPSPFLHMWTLAVEEQFYVVMPLVLYAARGCGATASVPGRRHRVARRSRVVHMDGHPGVADRRPHTRLPRQRLPRDGSARGGRARLDRRIGRAVAALHRMGAHRRSRFARVAPWAAVAALIAVLVTMRVATDRTIALYRGGFLVFGLVCAVIVVILAVMPDAPISKFLRHPVLVAIGLRSYSLYLWHWPVRVFLTPSSGLDGFALFAARLVMSVVLAELSFRFIERPFRVGRVARRTGSRGAIIYYAALTLISVILVTTVAAPQALPPTDLAKIRAIGGNADPKALRVDTFGDSTALVFGLAGAVHAKELGISVGGDAQLGCGVVQTDHVSGGRIIGSPAVCAGWRARWTASLHADPNARPMLMTGAWEILDQDEGSGTVKFGTPEWTQLISSSVRSALEVLTADGRTAYLFQVPCYG